MKLVKIIPAVLCFLLLSVPAYAKTYYVDVNAAQSKEEGSAENPFTKIQKAADIVEAGDTVLVAPGIYYESVTLKKSGTKDKPIVFRSLDSGENKTIITCANRDVREKKIHWKLEDEELQLYSIPYGRNVAGMLHNGARMLGYTSLEELKTFECWSGTREDPETTEGYPHGFYYDDTEKKLYVRLDPEEKYGSVDPNKNLMCVGGPYYEKIVINGVEDEGYRKGAISTDSYNFGIVTENSANVVLYGFTFETPGWCGVFVRADDVTVSNCWFKGCMTGVMGGRYSMHDYFVAKNVVVEYCDWNLWPTFEDAIDKVKQPSQKFPYRYYWWATKATLRSLMDYESGSFCAQAGRNWTIKNNHIYSCLDAFSWALSDGVYQPYEGSNINIDNADGIKMYENRFERCLDNAIETENHAKNMEIYNNEFINIFLPISWQPLGGKPWPTNISLHHNIFYDDKELVDLFLEKADYPLEWLKFGAPSSQWSRNKMALEEWDTDKNLPVKPIVMQDKGFMVYNNSVYIPDGYTSEVVGTLVGVNQDYNNSRVFNNLIYCRGQTEDQPFRTYILPGEFVPRDCIGQGFEHKSNAFIASNPENVTLNENSPGGKAFYTLEDAGVVLDNEVMYLTEDSPIRGSGMQIETEKRDTSDIGAVPYGEKWQIDYSPHSFGDVNCDGEINLTDIMMLAEKIGTVSSSEDYKSRYDLNFDGKVDDADLDILNALYVSL